MPNIHPTIKPEPFSKGSRLNIAKQHTLLAYSYKQLRCFILFVFVIAWRSPIYQIQTLKSQFTTFLLIPYCRSSQEDTGCIFALTFYLFRKFLHHTIRLKKFLQVARLWHQTHTAMLNMFTPNCPTMLFLGNCIFIILITKTHLDSTLPKPQALPNSLHHISNTIH